MSLLMTSTDPHMIILAQKVFDRQFAEDPLLGRQMDERRKQAMFQDILYNFSFLSTAVHLKDDKIFSNYAVWLYELLCNLMKDLDRDRIKEQMVAHYSILRRYVGELFAAEEAQVAASYLDMAIEVTDKAVDNVPLSRRFSEGKHVEVRKEYLSALMRGDTARAIATIKRVAAGGMPLQELYEDVIMETMREVGELWHGNLITIDKEHYCTSTTQMVLAMFYPDIFATPKKNHRILTCCVGSELHEMGGRMVSDLFEYHGWDSVYLGAAVPIPSLIHAVGEHKPDLVALSVTMPQYLQACRDAVHALRSAYPQLRIAVGGRAFSTSDGIQYKWPIDVYTELASELIEWAEQEVHSS